MTPSDKRNSRYLGLKVLPKTDNNLATGHFHKRQALKTVNKLFEKLFDDPKCSSSYEVK